VAVVVTSTFAGSGVTRDQSRWERNAELEGMWHWMEGSPAWKPSPSQVGDDDGAANGRLSFIACLGKRRYLTRTSRTARLLLVEDARQAWGRVQQSPLRRFRCGSTSGSRVEGVFVRASFAFECRALWKFGTDGYVQEGSARAGQGGSNFMQSFSLPGESQKAAKILKSFLGAPFSDPSTRPRADGPL
jgi:hypothetical protein